MNATEARKAVGSLRMQARVALTGWVVLLAILVLCALAAAVSGDAEKQSDLLWSGAALITVAWLLHMVVSFKQVRASNQAAVYISTGRLDLAERQLREALRSFSLFTRGRLLVCHNLAVVAHGRKEYEAAAELCRGVVSLGRGLSRSVVRLCRILWADCCLALGELAAAEKALAGMTVEEGGLRLSEALMLMPVELRCRLAMRDHGRVVSSLPEKKQMAELLDAPKAALVHAILAKACLAEGREAEADFFDRRSRLFHDREELVADYPILQDSPDEAANADNNKDIGA